MFWKLYWQSSSSSKKNKMKKSRISQYISRHMCTLSGKERRNSSSLEGSGKTPSLKSSKSGKSTDREVTGSISKLSNWSKRIFGDSSVVRDMDSVLESVMMVCKTSLGFETAGFVVLNEKNSKYYSQCLTGHHINDPTRGVGAHVMQHKSTVVIRDAISDGRFNLKVDEEKGCKTYNMICGAVVLDGKVFGVLYASNKRPVVESSNIFTRHCRIVPNTAELNEDDTILFNELLNSTSSSLRSSSNITSTLREQKRTAALVSLMRTATSGKSLAKILETTIEMIDQLVLPETISIFLCDHVKREAFVCATKHDDGFEGYTTSYDQGFAGTVASTGLAVRVDNADKDPRFTPGVDMHTGRVTKSVVCVAVPGYVNTHPIAVIQCVNKQNGSVFDEDDELSLRLVANELSTCLKVHAEELHDLNSALDCRAAPMSMLEMSLLMEYGRRKPRFRISSTPSYKKIRITHDSTENSAYASAVYTPKLALSDANNMIGNYNTDPFLITDDELIELTIHMFRSYGLLAKFSIPEAVLEKFLYRIQSMYHAQNQFHNFKHVWGVTHLCYQILRAGADQYLTSLDILALLIAAICHDIDHPGNNNAFEVACQSELAVLYADDTVLERHHIATTLKLLKMKEYDFLESLSPQEFTQVRKLITGAIMATDMAGHFEIVSQVTAASVSAMPIDNTCQDSRKQLLRFIIHAADIGAQTQCQELAYKWSRRVTREFTSQCERELELGLIPTPFMQGLDDDLKRMQLQHGFVNGIVLPLWSAMSELFPSLQESTNRAMDNKQYYLDRINAITAAMSTTISEDKETASSNATARAPLISARSTKGPGVGSSTKGPGVGSSSKVHGSPK